MDLERSETCRALRHILRINCAWSWFYLQDYIAMHGQQNTKNPDLTFTAVPTSNFKFRSYFPGTGSKLHTRKPCNQGRVTQTTVVSKYLNLPLYEGHLERTSQHIPLWNLTALMFMQFPDKNSNKPSWMVATHLPLHQQLHYYPHDELSHHCWTTEQNQIYKEAEVLFHLHPKI